MRASQDHCDCPGNSVDMRSEIQHLIDADRYSLIVDTAQEGICEMDSDFRTTFVNGKMAEMLGYTREEMLGVQVASFMFHDQLEDHTEKMKKRQIGKGDTYERRFIRKDGAHIWCNVSATSIVDEAGKFAGSFAMLTDITERKLAEEALRQSEEKYRTLFEDAVLGIFRSTPGGQYLDINHAFAAMYGYQTPAEMIENIDNIKEQLYVHTEDRDMISHLLSTVGEARGFVAENRHRDGHSIWISINARTIRNNEGEIIYYTGTVEDITERIRMEEDLRKARDLAKEACKIKSEFLAVMSHEVRSPLNGIIGMTELLLGSALTDVQVSYSRLIKSSARNLLGLMNDLLDLSRVEAHGIELKNTPFSLRSAMNPPLALLSNEAKEKGLRLISVIDDDVPDNLYGDSLRLSQILVNIVVNAVKFTEDGEITVHFSALQIENKEIELHISVKDTGCGIPIDKQDIIFEPFVQADLSSAGEHGGAGLGLAISKNIASLMGGDLTVESAPGKGSVFLFSAKFTLQSPNEPAVNEEPVESRNGKAFSLDILIAEDEAINRMFLAEYLKSRDHRTHAVADGGRALEELEHGSYDLMLIDIQMPVINGLEVIRAVRAKESGSGSHMFISALTGFATEKEKERVYSAGADACLTKPVDIDELDSLMEQAYKFSAGRNVKPHRLPDPVMK